MSTPDASTPDASTPDASTPDTISPDPSTPDTQPTSSVEQELRDLEDARYAAMENGDVDAFARLCHPALSYSHSNGARDTFETMVDKLRKRVFVYGPIDHPIERIVIEGSMALVIGQMSAPVEVNGVPRTLNNAALAVWTRGDGAWRLLAYQPTPLLA